MNNPTSFISAEILLQVTERYAQIILEHQSDILQKINHQLSNLKTNRADVSLDTEISTPTTSLPSPFQKTWMLDLEWCYIPPSYEFRISDRVMATTYGFWVSLDVIDSMEYSEVLSFCREFNDRFNLFETSTITDSFVRPPTEAEWILTYKHANIKDQMNHIEWTYDAYVSIYNVPMSSTNPYQRSYSSFMVGRHHNQRLKIDKRSQRHFRLVLPHSPAIEPLLSKV